MVWCLEMMKNSLFWLFECMKFLHKLKLMHMNYQDYISSSLQKRDSSKWVDYLSRHCSIVCLSTLIPLYLINNKNGEFIRFFEFFFFKINMIQVLVEGNIGCGKTTFWKKIGEAQCVINGNKVHPLKAQVEKWTNTPVGNLLVSSNSGKIGSGTFQVSVEYNVKQNSHVI